MTDEVTPAPEETQDTPESSAPQQGTSAEQESEFFDENFDPSALPEELQPAYKQMQGAFTRKTQTLAEQRKEAESALGFISALQSEDERSTALSQLVEYVGEDAVLEALGIELADDDNDEDDDDEQEPEFRDPRVDELLAEREQQAEAQRLDQIEREIDTGIQGLSKAAGVTLDEDEVELIWDKVLSLPPGSDGKPQVEAAFKKITGLRDKHIKAYRENRKPSPSPPPVGASGVPNVPVGDEKARRKLAQEVADRAYASASE